MSGEGIIACAPAPRAANDDQHIQSLRQMGIALATLREALAVAEAAAEMAIKVISELEASDAPR